MPKRNLNKEIFYFDAQIGAIRSTWNSGYILSIEFGRARNGRRLVVRPWNKGNDNSQRFMFRNRRLGSMVSYENKKLCIDSAGGRNTQNNKLIVYKCHKGLNQQWKLVDPTSKKSRIQTSRILKNRKFQIVSGLNSKRVLYHNEHIGGNQFRLRIRSPKYDIKEYFTYDDKTRTIRPA